MITSDITVAVIGAGRTIGFATSDLTIAVASDGRGCCIVAVGP